MKLDFVLCILLCILITAATRRKHALTWPAVLLADGMLTAIYFLSSIREVIGICAMYTTVFVVDMVLYAGRRKTDGRKPDGRVHAKGETRTLRQIAANGTAAMVSLILYAGLKKNGFLVGYYVCIFEVLADTIASDVGVLSKHRPMDIWTHKRIENGMSGGVSLLGLGSSWIACMAAGLLYELLCHGTLGEVLVVISFPYFGMLLDSILGSAVQVKYQCVVCGKITEKKEHCQRKTVWYKGQTWMTNGMVNFVTNLAAGCYLEDAPNPFVASNRLGKARELSEDREPEPQQSVPVRKKSSVFQGIARGLGITGKVLKGSMGLFSYGMGILLDDEDSSSTGNYSSGDDSQSFYVKDTVMDEDGNICRVRFDGSFVYVDTGSGEACIPKRYWKGNIVYYGEKRYFL